MNFVQFQKYLHPLKSPENAGFLDAFVVDEIFYQVPAILNVHQEFLEKLRRRLEQWDIQQKVGDVFLDVVSIFIVSNSHSKLTQKIVVSKKNKKKDKYKIKHTKNYNVI